MWPQRKQIVCELNHWQVAYTFSLQQIHTFIQGDGSAGNCTQDQLSQLNNQHERSKQEFDSDLSINVSDDSEGPSAEYDDRVAGNAASQQSSIANAIIEELTTLLM